MTAHCPKHGDVLPINGFCPWCRDRRIIHEPEPVLIPTTDPRIELPALLASRQITLETA